MTTPKCEMCPFRRDCDDCPWSGENLTAATVSDARTGAWRGGGVVSATLTWTCATCTDNGRKGYCAPLRCYCGHETCHAAGSREVRTESVADVIYLHTPRKPKSASAWASREEGSSWIDKL